MADRPKFKTGDQVKFIKGWLSKRARPWVVLGPVKGSKVEAYKIGPADDPFNQAFWRRINATFLDYASVIDKLGSIATDD